MRDSGVARVLEHRGRLRIVHHHVVPVAFELQGVVEYPLEVHPLHLVVPLHLGALERVVDLLRDAEELVAAVDHLPLGVDPEILEQRDVCREELGDPAAVRGRVHVEHSLTAKWRGQLANPLERIGPDRGFVVVEVLVEQRYTFEQRNS